MSTIHWFFTCNFERLKRIIPILIATLMFSGSLKAQYDSSLVQLSGLVMTADSLRALPYVLIKNSHRKVVSVTDYEGFFSLVVKKGDTIYFSQISLRTTAYIVPMNLTESRYSIVQLMANDTINLPVTVIKPWPTKRQFDHDFVHGTFDDDQLEVARKNMSKEELNEISLNMTMDGAENYRAYMNKQYQQNYWMGQSPPIRLLDPLAWAQFFNAWKAGKYKKKKQ